MFYIDSHNHMHTFPFDDWELVGISGMRACIISAGNPGIYRESINEAPGKDKLKYLWEHPLSMISNISKYHFIDMFVMIGISSMTQVEQPEVVIEMMETYLDNDRVVAIGEVGLDPVQYYGLEWPLKEQNQVLLRQMEIAKKHNLPLVLHTPMPKSSKNYPIKDKDLPAANQYKKYYLEMDLSVAANSKMDQERIVIDHCDETIIPFVMKETNAYAGISIASSLRPTLTPQYIAEIVKEYGPDRIILNSDICSEIPSDLLSIPKVIREMRRRSIPDEDIHKVVFSNANWLFQLGLTEETAKIR